MSFSWFFFITSCLAAYFFLSFFPVPPPPVPNFFFLSSSFPPPLPLLSFLFLLYLLLFLLAASYPCFLFILYLINFNLPSPPFLTLLLCRTISVSSNFCLSNSNSLYLFCNETICGHEERCPVFTLIGSPMMLFGRSGDVFFCVFPPYSV